MSSESTSGKQAGPEGKVRLRRFAIVAVPAAVAGGALVVLTAQGVLAAQFAISGMPFTVTATQLQGTGMEQFGSIDNIDPNDTTNLQQENGQQPVIVTAITHATLADLCQSVSLGFVNLVIHAGQNGKPVDAEHLIVDSDQISGDATFSQLNVDIDPGDMTDTPWLQPDQMGQYGIPYGTFAQEAQGIEINNLRQDNWATTASTFTLPGMSIGFSDNGC